MAIRGLLLFTVEILNLRILSFMGYSNKGYAIFRWSAPARLSIPHRDYQTKVVPMRSNSLRRISVAASLTMALAAGAADGTFKRISIDGSFADWAGVPIAWADPSETTAGADFRDVYVANDEQYLYIRFTLYTNDTPFTSRNNIFIDGDNNSASGFHPLGLAFGSEMLIQSGTGYQEKNGGFNEGAINGLGWTASPTGSAVDFELRISRAAMYASDSAPVFTESTIAILLESENTSFVAVDLAPDTGSSIIYSFANPPPPLSGSLQLIPLTGFLWRYDDLGGDGGTLWREPAFDDAGEIWRDGSGLFGFTTNAAAYPAPIQTSLNPGRTTYYFRAYFEWTNDSSGVVLVASNYLSDGAAFYLNGTEMKRLRLPAGPVLFDTPATGGPAVKGQVELAGFSAGALVIGTNVLAVETHQTAGDTNDMVFGLSLLATTQFPVVFTDSTQPTNRNVVAGQPTTFAAEVIGSPPLSYQWYKDGQPISGATNATFTINSVLASDAGSYQVRVSNSVSTDVPSRSAILTVGGEPVRITVATQPADQTITEGDGVIFNVVATGSAPLSYQWFKGSTPIPNATNVSYAIPSVRVSDAGNYYAVVSNPLPSSATSRTAVLTVRPDTTPPAVQTVVASLNRIVITFSEPVDETTAEQTGNYTINGLNVVAAVRSADNPTEVVLTTGPQTLGEFRCIAINNVRDLFNNPIQPISVPFVSTILIDGSFDDWAGVPLALQDAVDQPTASDYKDVYITNDADHIFVRITLHAPSDLAIFYNNIFVDSDNNAGTGFSFRIGSEMLIQGGGGYQEKNGGFNEGGINGLDWAISPEGVGTDFEFRFSRHATYESDGKQVFTNSTIALVFDAENTSFQTVDTAPDAGGLTYVLYEPPTVLGPLSITREFFGDLTINWPGEAELQARTSLTSGAWQTLHNGAGPYSAGIPAATQTFYRLLRPCP